MKIQAIFFVLATIGLFGQATAQEMAMTHDSHETITEKQDIVAIAASNDDFATLVAAVTAADLVTTLQSEGPFTVFAPTNEAFAKLPKGTVESLLEPANKKQLQTILTYHVIAGELKAADVIAAIEKGKGKASVKTVSGGMLTAKLKNGSVWLIDENGNKSKVTATDIEASNGVIHVIDNVVLPK